MLKIVTVVGARPQFIKAATVSRAISCHNQKTRRQDFIHEILVHTGQHYDENMSKIFFDELLIPRPDYNLGIGSDTHGRQTGKMIAGIEEVLINEKPDIVLTYGDTNSTLAGALTAAKLHIPSAHIEAGLRSYNRKMPEEINRVVADELSNLLFCPTENAVKNLHKEGINLKEPIKDQVINCDTQMVFCVGDVMYDSILFNKRLADNKSRILDTLGLRDSSDERNRYCLATIHRENNTDNFKNLKNILDALKHIASNGIHILFPVHPRTKKCIQKIGIANNGCFYYANCEKRLLKHKKQNSSYSLRFLSPLGYLDMLQLEKHAMAIVTDSGGVQKEAYLLKVPCITVRNETEWIETVQKEWNILTGPNTEKIIAAFSTVSRWKGERAPFSQENKVIRSNRNIGKKNVFGNGKAAEKIIDIILNLLNK